MAFDTTVFEQKELREAINKLEELLSHSKAVLLGAGASFCAGLPLTNQLTERALISDKLSDDSKQILTAIQNSFAGANPASHIEDYLSELVDWLAITARRTNRNVTASSVLIGGTEVSTSDGQNIVSIKFYAPLSVSNTSLYKYWSASFSSKRATCSSGTYSTRSSILQSKYLHKPSK